MNKNKFKNVHFACDGAEKSLSNNDALNEIVKILGQVKR